jgi:hypothetical protein
MQTLSKIPTLALTTSFSRRMPGMQHFPNPACKSPSRIWRARAGRFHSALTCGIHPRLGKRDISTFRGTHTPATKYTARQTKMAAGDDPPIVATGTMQAPEFPARSRLCPGLMAYYKVGCTNLSVGSASNNVPPGSIVWQIRRRSTNTTCCLADASGSSENSNAPRHLTPGSDRPHDMDGSLRSVFRLHARRDNRDE